MDIPSEVITAVKETKADLVVTEKAPTQKWVKESTKRVLHAVGNGLRTASSIANALGEPKAKITSRLWHLKDKGLLHATKKQGSNEYKYYLTTDKPTLAKFDLTKPKRKYTKRKVTSRTANPADFYDEDGVNTGNTFNSAPKVAKPKDEQVMLNRYIRELEMKLHNITNKLSLLEMALADKDKEMWTLECEIFDKKAIIKYLESKLTIAVDTKGTI